MKKLNVLVLALSLVFLVACEKDQAVTKENMPTKTSAQVECITFDNPDLARGTIPTVLYTDGNSGPVGVRGINPAYPDSNAAMIFNSATNTGGDPDLCTPHEDFGGPGKGADGGIGSTYPNDTFLGKIMIVSENWNSDNPDDLDGAGELDFDFSALGAVDVHSMTIIDVEGSEGAPTVNFYDAGDNLITTIALPVVGDNGVATTNFGPVNGVVKMKVLLQGSGAIDNICIQLPPPPPANGCTHTIGYWKTHAGFGPQADVVTQYLPINLGNGGAKTLVVTTNTIARDVLNQKTYGKPNNGITKLYAQLLAAKLSIADGSDATPVAGIISDADAFLTNNDWNDWKSLSKNMKNTVNAWKTALDNYNNGKTGVAHCD